MRPKSSLEGTKGCAACTSDAGGLLCVLLEGETVLWHGRLSGLIVRAALLLLTLGARGAEAWDMRDAFREVSRC